MTTKNRIITMSICLVIVLFLITCVSFRFTALERLHGRCISVAFFEKWKMWSVDKVVIETDTGKRIEITDSELIDDILDETLVATHATQSKHGGYERWIYLYDGDELVRSMEWACGDLVEVYEADACHWLFSPLDSGSPKIGYIYLSDELVDELEILINDA